MGSLKGIIGGVLGFLGIVPPLSSTLSSEFDKTVYLDTGDPAATPIPDFDKDKDWSVGFWTKSNRNTGGPNQWVLGLGTEVDGWFRLVYIPQPVDLWLVGIGDETEIVSIDTSATSTGYWDFDKPSEEAFFSTVIQTGIGNHTAFTWLAAAYLGTGEVGTTSSLGSGGGGTWFGLQANTGDVVRGITLAGGFRSNTTTDTWSDDTWHAYASHFTSDSGGILRAFLDGVASSGDSTGSGAFTVKQIDIGRLSNASSGSYWPGRLAEIVLVQGRLTEAQIDEWATGGAGGSILAAPLCSWATQAVATGQILAYWPARVDNRNSFINNHQLTMTDVNGGPTFVSTGGPVVEQAIDNENWNYWVLKHETGVGLSISVNAGAFQFLFATTGATSAASHDRLTVGRAVDSGGSPVWGYDGFVDEVTLWETLLSDATVAALFAFTDPSTVAEAADLVEFWRMGEDWNGSAIPGQEGTDDLTAAGGFTASDLSTDVPP